MNKWYKFKIAVLVFPVLAILLHAFIPHHHHVSCNPEIEHLCKSDIDHIDCSACQFGHHAKKHEHECRLNLVKKWDKHLQLLLHKQLLVLLQDVTDATVQGYQYDEIHIPTILSPASPTRGSPMV